MLRFISTPTGDIDIGNLQVALINYIVSKQLNKNLLIYTNEKEQQVLELLNLFSIDYTQVVSSKSNIKYHTQMGMKLLLDNKGFNCYCSDEALQQDKEEAKKNNQPYSYSGFCETISDEAKFQCNAPFMVRIKKPTDNIVFTDILLGKINFSPLEIDSFPILHRDKLPTDTFATAVDDMLYDISMIITEQKYLNDTAKQIHIRNSLGYTKEIKYLHTPNIDDKILIQTLIDDGYLPVAIANYLILMIYNDTPTEIFSLEDAIQWLDITKLSKSTTQFDIEKLASLNREYINNIDDMRLSKLLGYADNDIGKLAKLYLEESNTLKELKTKLSAVFNKKEPLDKFETQSKMIQQSLKKAEFFDNFDDLVIYLAKQTSLNDDQLLTPLRYILTGATTGPKLDHIYNYIKNYLGEII